MFPTAGKLDEGGAQRQGSMLGSVSEETLNQDSWLPACGLCLVPAAEPVWPAVGSHRPAREGSKVRSTWVQVLEAEGQACCEKSLRGPQRAGDSAALFHKRNK